MCSDPRTDLWRRRSSDVIPRLVQHPPAGALQRTSSPLIGLEIRAFYHWLNEDGANLEIVNGSGGCMQATASVPTVNPPPTNPPPLAEMDLQAMQSMDWLFKKERIYLLAQFWQQVSPGYVAGAGRVRRGFDAGARERLT